MTTLQATGDQASISLRILQKLFGNYHPRDFAVRLWNEASWDPDPGQEARFTLVLRHPGSLRKMFSPPVALSFPEAHVFDDFDVEGDFLAFFGMVRHLIANRPGFLDRVRLGLQMLKLPSAGQPHVGHEPVKLKGTQRSRERDRQAISYTYDLSNKFYALWLDRHMQYTCGYFASPTDDLDTAQERKLDYVCRKLRLRAGERLLDIGCGWGGLIIYAAQHYGVEAVGVTLSQRQFEMAQERIREAGLTGRCRVELRDYREIEEQTFDKVSSVGILEHLGPKMLPTFFQGIWRLLRPGGLSFNQAISLRENSPFPPWTAFARRYVFPDGELMPISTMLRGVGAIGFEVRDVESLREHYVLTLRHWIERLQAHADEVRQVTSEATYRIYRLYLTGAMLGFEQGTYNLYQVVLSKPDQGVTRLPLTRTDLYEPTFVANGRK
jgi:cyclopropane-fatty-acyl-phospholipid synthase